VRHSIRRCSLLALVVLPVAFAEGAAPASAACNAGVHPFGKVQSRTFCGPASAKVKIGSKSVTVKGGECARTSASFALNIGTIVLGSAPKRPDYFGVTVLSAKGGAPVDRDGTFTKNAVVALVYKNAGYAIINATVTLKSGRTKGTFSGQLLGKSTKVSGSFSCR